MKEFELAPLAADRLLSVLDGVPAIESVEVLDGAGMGRSLEGGGTLHAEILAVVRLTGGETHTLVVDVKRVGHPRYGRLSAAWFGRRLPVAYEEGLPNPYPVFAAPYVSDRGAAVAAEEGMGYFDLAGNARLAFGPVYVERSGHTNPDPEGRPLASLFAPKTSRVARALLAHPARAWRLQELADEVDVSIGLVAKAKESLLDAEYARDTPDGLALADPDGLVDAWLAADRRRPKPRGYYSLDGVADAERRVCDAVRASGARAALTSFSGAERVAPHVRYSHASVLVEADALEEVAERAGLRPVETGANVRLHEPYDNGAFYGARDVDGLPVAHPVQLVLDLAREKGRGEEAADHLRRHALAPTWADLRPARR
ncbi:type IV toxin-antitoxin system AbiEi family antitoxin [Rubrivirga marina]|uniref:Uncharacterized protein n=1 Tax=Rubrivirga marina TaxID=1196024 RepID=A0A271ITI3_9BACT|nr:type IV toxin-antitoxin system AbiEi family antitoxin [Rubrivirga marina]PAP74546.1 hypothetical protein BSZ37_20410 [Rubrivirga marina]